MKKIRIAFCCIFASIILTSLFALGGCGAKKYTVQYWTGELVSDGGNVWDTCSLYWSPHETEVEEGRAFLYNPPTISYTRRDGGIIYAHFQGWYLDTNFAIEFRPANGIQTDTILYAKYDYSNKFIKK